MDEADDVNVNQRGVRRRSRSADRSLFTDDDDDGFQLPPLVQEFFVPVWHQVRLSAAEVSLVNHPAFARLADFYQLGQTHLVYRGATHKRWEHALGTLHAAQLLASAIERNHAEAAAKNRSQVTGQWRRSRPLRSYEVAFVRLAALLHDIGHIAAGHTFEDELGVLDKHDADARLIHVLDRKVWRNKALDRTLREVIDTLYREPASATGLGTSATDILLDIISKSRTDKEPSSTGFRLRVCRDLVGNTICADLLDYIHRDWHHLGKPREFDARLLDYFEIRENVDNPLDARLVLNLREGAGVRLDAVTAVFELLESRYQLGEIALFHRTKLIASAMLERLVAEVADGKNDATWFPDQVDKFLECTDEEMVAFLAATGREVLSEGGGSRYLEGALDLARRLRYRELHKEVVAMNSFDLAGGVEFVRKTYSGVNGADARLSTARALEADFRLPFGSVVLYCPPSGVHAKIAQVQVLVHEAVMSLVDLEKGNDRALTGGLLQAQLSRFDRLWRVQVSVAADALEQLGAQDALADFEEAIAVFVLRLPRGRTGPPEIAEAMARRLLQNPRFPVKDKDVLSSAEVYARGAQLVTYRSGAPTLMSLWRDRT